MNDISVMDDGKSRLVYRLPRTTRKYSELREFVEHELRLPVGERSTISVQTAKGMFEMKVATLEEGTSRYMDLVLMGPTAAGEAAVDGAACASPDAALPRKRAQLAGGASRETTARPIGNKRRREPDLSESLLREMVGVVYTLRIRTTADVFYYVGSSEDMSAVPPPRVLEHCSASPTLPRLLQAGEAGVDNSALSLFGYELVPRGRDGDNALTTRELLRTHELMDDHGTSNVRGGPYCRQPFGQPIGRDAATVYQSATNKDYCTGACWP